MRVFSSGVVRNELGTVDFIFQELSVWAKAGVAEFNIFVSSP